MTGYVYDADGTRVAKGTITSMSCDPSVNGILTAGNETDYVLGSGGEQVTELAQDANGTMNWQRSYVYGAGGLIGTYDPDPDNPSQPLPSFRLTDWLGTLRATTDAYGVAQGTCTGLPFGDGVSCSGDIPDNHHFTGKERDAESGNDYFGARYYASSMGRFMSPDPLLNSGRPGNPQTWNRYAYALNNPLKIADPTGLYNIYCGSDKNCLTAERNLKNGLADLQKRVDKMKDGNEKTRLEASLKAIGTENDGNTVNVKFAAISSGAGGKTDPVYDEKTGKESYNVTLDPNASSNVLAINGAHEGQHVSDISTELANPSGQPVLSDFSMEYRGYQTSVWAASALGEHSLTETYDGKPSVIWNGSWGTVDKNITNFVTSFHDKNGKQTHPETTLHNPWSN